MPTTDADLLRKAAALIRERAEAASAGPWKRFECECGELVASAFVAHPRSAEHIASWHPAVALVVADLLEAVARAVEHVGTNHAEAASIRDEALRLARIYLGADHA